MSSFPRRWCWVRLKRTLLLCSFTSLVVVIVVMAFVALNNSSGVHTFLVPNRPRIAGKNGVDASRRSQFFPDRHEMAQNRKSELEMISVKEDYARRRRPPKRRRTAAKIEQGKSTATAHAVEGANAATAAKTDEDSVKSELGQQQQQPNRRQQKNATTVEAPMAALSYDVHAFYYAWYDSPVFSGGRWWHWNHEYIPNWDKSASSRSVGLPTGRHEPPHDIAANFYPQLGPYSSRDPAVVADHMRQLRSAGVGVIVVSWYPPGQADENGPPSDQRIPALLDAAQQHELKLAVHVEPYENITAENFRNQLQYVVNTYGLHPAFYKRSVGRRRLPVFYIYDSYRVQPEQWRRLFSRKGDLSIRDSELDGIFLGLYVEYKHRFDIKRAAFDGLYTYFAANGFTHGSSWKNWNGLASFTIKNSLMFVPSVGPGYIDTRVRAWNTINNRKRINGSYYDMSWRWALSTKPKIVCVTSFNEWHEGTQIEAAVPKEAADGFTYLSYEPQKPDFYLKQTQKWVVQFINQTRS